MGFEQDFIRDYNDWKAEQTKAAKTPQDRAFNGKLFAKMGAIRNDLVKIGKALDQKIVNTDTITGKAAIETLPIICNDFVSEIAKIKDVIKTNDADFNWFFDYDLIRKYEKSETLLDFLDIADHNLRMRIGMSKPSEETLNKPEEIAAYNMLKFIHDIFTDIKIYFVEIEKIEAKDEDFFDIEGESEAKSSSTQDKESAKPDKGYLSKLSDAMEYLFPNVWKRWEKTQRSEATEVQKEEAKPKRLKLSTVPEGVKMFPEGKPLTNEVQQAGVSDCFLMAVLISLAKTNPKAIEDCFPQGLKNLDKQEKITVRFYGEDKSGHWTKIDITVDKKKVVESGKIKGNALWPKIIEKAYVVYKNRDYLPESKKKPDICGGYSTEIYRIITGNEPKTILNPKGKLNPYTDKEMEKIISDITSALRSKKRLTCEFLRDISIKDPKNGKSMVLKKNELYTIERIEGKAENAILFLKNQYESDAPEFAINIRDFCTLYREIETKTHWDIEKDAQKIISEIKPKLKKRKGVVCEFKQNFETKDAKNGKPLDLKRFLSYRIEEIVEEPRYYVVLRELFGDELFAISIEDFCENYDNIDYGEYYYDIRDEVKDEPSIITKIKSELKKGHSLTCGFKNDYDYIKDVKTGDEIFLSGSHAYAITGFRDADDPKNKTGIGYIRLNEPNKAWGRNPEHNRKSKEGGHVAISFEDFALKYQNVDVSGDKRHKKYEEETYEIG